MDLYFNYIDGMNFLMDSPHLIPILVGSWLCEEVRHELIVVGDCLPRKLDLSDEKWWFHPGFRQEKGLISGSIIVVNND